MAPPGCTEYSKHDLAVSCMTPATSTLIRSEYLFETSRQTQRTRRKMHNISAPTSIMRVSLLINSVFSGKCVYFCIILLSGTQKRAPVSEMRNWHFGIRKYCGKICLNNTLFILYLIEQNP